MQNPQAHTCTNQSMQPVHTHMHIHSFHSHAITRAVSRHLIAAQHRSGTRQGCGQDLVCQIVEFVTFVEDAQLAARPGNGRSETVELLDQLHFLCHCPLAVRLVLGCDERLHEGLESLLMPLCVGRDLRRHDAFEWLELAPDAFDIVVENQPGQARHSLLLTGYLLCGHFNSQADHAFETHQWCALVGLQLRDQVQSAVHKTVCVRLDFEGVPVPEDESLDLVRAAEIRVVFAEGECIGAGVNVAVLLLETTGQCLDLFVFRPRELVGCPQLSPSRVGNRVRLSGIRSQFSQRFDVGQHRLGLLKEVSDSF
mmetsp:Transcript_35809/g.102969  ORF Transcript_35809/g.102969 Transcript_35809/m.102969 type:complete len:311 (-) Transcript_35809:1114-2046(-)